MHMHVQKFDYRNQISRVHGSSVKVAFEWMVQTEASTGRMASQPGIFCTQREYITKNCSMEIGLRNPNMECTVPTILY